MKRFMDWASDKCEEYERWEGSLREPWGCIAMMLPIIALTFAIVLPLMVVLWAFGIELAFPVHIVNGVPIR